MRRRAVVLSLFYCWYQHTGSTVLTEVCVRLSMFPWLEQWIQVPLVDDDTVAY
jgi:hypothetical protein